MVRTFFGLLLAVASFCAGHYYANACRPVNTPVGSTANSSKTSGATNSKVQALTETPVAPEIIGPKMSSTLPNVSLINQQGTELKFVDDLVRDRITCTFFFYTNCEGTCPGTVQKVRQLRDRVANEFPGIEVAFVGITLDPEHDSPDVLLKYSGKVVPEDSNPHDWHFCTGTKEDIEELRYALGMYDLNPQLDSDRTQHAAMVVIGNDLQNRWVTMPSGLSADALTETFLRMAGQSEKQRFAMTYSTTVAAGSSEEIAGSCCSNKKKCCESEAEPLATE